MSAGSLLQTRTGPIIPLYVAANSALWTTVMNQKDAHTNVPIAVVINIEEGPGTAAQSAWQTTINNLAAKGIIVLGYVNTDFANRPEADVNLDVDRWFNFYNASTTLDTRKVDGIYFAHMSNSSANQSYYHNINTRAKATVGFKTTCGGAGTKVPTAFLGDVADTVILFEGSGHPPISDYQAYQTTNRNATGFLVFGIGTLNDEWLNQASSISNWIYVTNDSGVNPWDTLPPYFADLITKLDQLGTGGSGGSQFDTFGIRKMYHTSAGGQEWYVNMNDPVSDERFQNEPALTRNNDGSWSCEGSSDHQVRLEAWSPALSNDTDRQNARWLNAEITGYLKAETEFAQGGAYLFQEYIRGGHHSSNTPCEGSTLKAAISRRRRSGSDPGLSAYCRKEVCHSSYCDNRAVVNDAVPWTSNDMFNKWIGMKLVVYNVDSNTHTKQEIYLDPDVQDSNGNLNAQNNWQLVTSNIDTGGWEADQSSFDSDCDGCGYARDRIILAAGGNTNSGSANYHRNLGAWRTDDLRFRFKYLTLRQIDPTKPGTGTAPPPPSTDPGSQLDAFGVRKIYPTKQGGNEWYVPDSVSGAQSDPRFHWDHALTDLADGTGWRVQLTAEPFQHHLGVYAVTGYDRAATEAAAANHSQVAANGFMYRNGDWRNVEMTIYVKVDQVVSNTIGEIILYARGGEHRDPQPYCSGSSMKGYLLTNGQTRFAKEQYHIYYNYSDLQNQINQDLFGRFVGMKFVLYNRKIGTQAGVKMEIYVDNGNNNTWVKVDEKMDTSGWGTGGLECNAPVEHARISWGGPIAYFRFDNIRDFTFAKMSVREIDGDAIPVEAPAGQNPGSCQTT